VYRCVYASRSNKRGDIKPEFRRGGGRLEGNHESENVERKSGIKVFEDGSDTAQEKVDDSDGGSVVVNGSRHARSVVGATNKSGRKAGGYDTIRGGDENNIGVGLATEVGGGVHEPVGGSRAVRGEQNQNRGESQIEEPVGRV